MLYRHLAGRCEDCHLWVRQAGEGEILGSRIGPRLRAWAVYLRNGIGISYRKVPAALEELLGIRFSPAALLGFERMLAELAQPLAEDIVKKIASTDGAVHADETYWTHEKALTLQKRIRKHAGQWLVFLDDPRVPPTDNLAERALRPLVVLRKITFGHRSQAGAQRMATLMTIQETAKRHQRRPTDIFYRLYTHPPSGVLRYHYAGRPRSS